MNGWSQHVRRVSVALAGAVAVVAVAVAVPATASASVTASTKPAVTSGTHTPSKPLVRHTDVWEW